MNPQFDYLIAGGGLHGSLLALALQAERPRARIALVERNAALGGNHLWSFHAGDLPPRARPIVQPLIVRRWPAYRVAFPDRERRLDEEYAAISSDRLDAHVRNVLPPGSIRLGSAIETLDARGVRLAGGETLEARLVIDARGPTRFAGAQAWQKFAGIELRGARAPELPTLMDARVPQRDGFRFMYVLPLAPDRVLVEDTRFSLSAALDVAAVERDALAWAHAHGLAGEIVRREHGVLPLPIDALPEFSARPPLRAGYAGGFFHPVTGYSFPAAIRLALHVASRAPEDIFDAAYASLIADLRAQQRFALLLNRLLYRAVGEENRWAVLSRFYGLPAATARRFYALSTTRADRARIVCGRPPRGISLRKALEAIA